MSYRPNVNMYREPVQQGLTVDPSDYTEVYHRFRPVLGVVLSVFYADDPDNRYSVGQSDNRTSVAMCRVLVVYSGSSSMQIIDNVVITPDAPAGMDNYSEFLPTPTTALIDGTPYNEQMFDIDPNLLNGDRCIIGWMAGSQDRPFVLRWWPHPANASDPATSGKGNRVNGNTGTTLSQNGRLYRRTNGVEHVVTKKGDVYFSTHYANSTPSPQDGVKDGRVARVRLQDGGSVKAWIKTSESFEMDWNAPVDGLGIQDQPDASLPQTNPRTGGFGTPSKASTWLRATSDAFSLQTPSSIDLRTGSQLNMTSSGSVSMTATDDVSVVAGSAAAFVGETVSVEAASTLECNSSTWTAATTDLTFSAASTMSLASASMSFSASSISFTGVVQLGSPAAVSGVYLSAPINAQLAFVSSSLLGPSFDALPTPAQVAALRAALQQVISAFTTGVSTVVFSS